MSQEEKKNAIKTLTDRGFTQVTAEKSLNDIFEKADVAAMNSISSKKNPNFIFRQLLNKLKKAQKVHQKPTRKRERSEGYETDEDWSTLPHARLTGKTPNPFNKKSKNGGKTRKNRRRRNRKH